MFDESSSFRGLAVFILILPILTNCAVIENQQRVVFDQGESMEEIHPVLESCGEVNDQKTYNVLHRYQPSEDLYAHVRLLSDKADRTVFLGPGILLPLPLIPNPIALVQELDRGHRLSQNPPESLRVAIYPVAYSQGYTFNPNEITVTVGSNSLRANDISKLQTHNRRLLPVVPSDDVNKLPSHSGEYLVYMLSFDLPDTLDDNLVLEIGGFSHRGKQSSRESLPLGYDSASMLSWRYDLPCKL